MIEDDEVETIWRGGLKDDTRLPEPVRVPMAVTHDRVLRALTRRAGPMTILQIVDEGANLKTPSVYETLRGMVRTGLVMRGEPRCTSPTGRPQHTYRLTPAGQAAALSLRRKKA